MNPMNKAKLLIKRNPLLSLLKHAVQEFQDDNATRLAAALAYHTALSLAPLLLVVVALAGLLFSREMTLRFLLDEVSGLIGKDGAELIRSILQQPNQEERSILAAAVGTATLLLGATGVFNHLHKALNEIWDVPEEQKPQGIIGMLRARLFSFGIVLSVGFLLLVSLVVSAALSALDEVVYNIAPSIQFLLIGVNFAVSFLLISLLFAAIYKLLPDTDIAWQDVWVGAGITGILFAIGKFAIGLYLGNSSVGSAYGAAGSFVVLLVWIYYSAQIFFFGAELTQAYANRYGSRIGQEVPIAPTPQADEPAHSQPIPPADPATAPAPVPASPPWQANTAVAQATPLVVEGVVVPPQPVQVVEEPLPVGPQEEGSNRWVGALAGVAILIGSWVLLRRRGGADALEGN